jgi:hypothetical protein
MPKIRRTKNPVAWASEIPNPLRSLLSLKHVRGVTDQKRSQTPDSSCFFTHHKTSIIFMLLEAAESLSSEIESTIKVYNIKDRLHS